MALGTGYRNMLWTGFVSSTTAESDVWDCLSILDHVADSVTVSTDVRDILAAYHMQAGMRDY